jgi:hypothetical protein
VPDLKKKGRCTISLSDFSSLLDSDGSRNVPRNGKICVLHYNKIRPAFGIPWSQRKFMAGNPSPGVSIAATGVLHNCMAV